MGRERGKFVFMFVLSAGTEVNSVLNAMVALLGGDHGIGVGKFCG